MMTQRTVWIRVTWLTSAMRTSLMLVGILSISGCGDGDPPGIDANASETPDGGGNGPDADPTRPDAEPGTPSTIGWPDYFGVDGSWLPNLIYAVPVEVPAPVTVTRLGLHGIANGATAQIAVYTDDGSGPATLVFGTAPFTIASGANEVDVTAPGALDTGTYWLAAVFGSTSALVGIEENGPTVDLHYGAHPAAMPLPGTFPTEIDNYDSGAPNWWMVVTK
jgi:hypothetical protein